MVTMRELSYFQMASENGLYCMGAAAKARQVQMACEITTGQRVPRRRYNSPQNRPATPAAPMSMKFKDEICTPA